MKSKLSEENPIIPNSEETRKRKFYKVISIYKSTQ